MDVVTLGAALSIMKKMPDTAASSAAAAEDAADRAQAAAEQAEGAIEVDDTLSVEGRAADAKVVGDRIAVVENDLGIIGHSVSEYTRTGYKIILSDLQFVNGHTYIINGNYENTGNIGNLRITFDDESTYDLQGTSSNAGSFSIEYSSTKTSLVEIKQYVNVIGGKSTITIKDVTERKNLDTIEETLDALGTVSENTVTNLNGVLETVSMLKKDIWNLGNGLPVSTDGVISIMSTSSFEMFGAVALENTDYTVFRHCATFNTLNRIFVMFLNKVIKSRVDFDPSYIVGTPIIETEATQGLKKDSLISPLGTKMILVCVPKSSLFWVDGRDTTPTIIYTDTDGRKKIIPDKRDTLTLDDIALNPSVNVQQDGSVLFDATNGSLSLMLPNVYKTNETEKNSIFTFVTKSEGISDNSAPYVIFGFDKLYKTIPYSFLNADFEENQFRIPFFGDFDYYKTQLIVPAGMKLYIKRISHHHTDYRRTYATGVRLSAHLGIITLAPENSAIGFKIAAKAGYSSAICNPKVTSDGVLVCCHDTKINSIARNSDGTTIDEDVFIASNTYETLNQYDYGIKLDSMYAGTKLLTLEEFFKICAVYGIAPIFSIHHSSDPLSAEDWVKIKTLCQKYGLTESLLVKSGSMRGLEIAYETMGDSVFGYVYDLGGVSVADGIAQFDASAVHQTSARKYIGISRNVISDSKVNSVISAGYMCEMYDIYSMTSQLYKHYMELGVSEFVDDQNPSYGYWW